MVLFLHSADQKIEAKRLLVEAGLEHKFVGPTLVEVSGEKSVWRPEALARWLSPVGRLEGLQSSTPLIDGRSQCSVTISRPGSPIVVAVGHSPLWIAGPCSIDDSTDLLALSKRIASLGFQVLRGGALKPRTSPHQFQGVGRNGYRSLAEAAHGAGLACVSEAYSEDDVEEAAEYLDLIQVGARNMQNFALLKKLAKVRKPVLLKRAPGATLWEWASAAEYLVHGGNDQVILCERGVRGLEREMRYTLDLVGAVFMQQRFGLPVVVDPSHGTGTKEVMSACTAGALAMGCSGIMLETHPEPVNAQSDGLQALTLDQLASIAQTYIRK
jgi:3-deoxy-7-phosphoheptulonate synthase